MALKVVGQTLLAFVVTFLVVRLLGKREVSRGTFWQFISAIVIGSLGGSMVLDGVTGVYAKAGAVLLWGGFTLLISFATLKNRWFRGVMDSKPSIVIHNGKILEEAMTAERLHLEGLLEALRQKQVASLADVEFAILETSGRISVIKKSQKRPVTPADLKLPTAYAGMSTELVLDGELVRQNLHQVGLSEAWLWRELQLRGISDLKEVTVASLDSEGRLYVDVRRDPLGDRAHRPGDMLH